MKTRQLLKNINLDKLLYNRKQLIQPKIVKINTDTQPMTTKNEESGQKVI